MITERDMRGTWDYLGALTADGAANYIRYSMDTRWLADRGEARDCAPVDAIYLSSRGAGNAADRVTRAIGSLRRLRRAISLRSAGIMPRTVAKVQAGILERPGMNRRTRWHLLACAIGA